jgi:DNA repair protein RadC
LSVLTFLLTAFFEGWFDSQSAVLRIRRQLNAHVCRAATITPSEIILVHNQPSGDPKPSPADIQMTKAIVDIVAPLGISVHDHIIVGKNGHASFKALKLI